MKRLIIFLLILAGSVWLGVQIHTDPGYLLLAYRHWTVEMPLWFGAVLSILFFFIFYGLLRLISGTRSIGDRLQSWWGRRRIRRSQSLMSRGLIELMEGHWQVAEKNLIRAAESSEIPLVNYLAAARAAQEQGSYERRDDYLRMAHRSTPDAEVAVGVAQAELQLNHDQLEHALASLQHVRELAPHHTYILKLLKNVYLKLCDWKNLAELLPQLQKSKVISNDELLTLQEKTYQELIKIAAQQKESSALKTLWASMPRDLHKDNFLLKHYVAALIEKGEGAEAEVLIRDALKRTWDDDLARYYGLAISSDVAKQLATAETWLKSQSHNPSLLLSLGRLSILNQLWGKARSYLESSLDLAPSAETYRELGRLLDLRGEEVLANECYRKGLLATA